MKRPSINPITRKRWTRFKQRKRAFYSLIVLLTLYGLSLFAELICNNRPVYMQLNGKHYVPVLRYYSEDTFLQNGRLTRTNYKSLQKSPLFRDHPENFMLFPIIPCSPFENMNPDDISSSKYSDIQLTRIPRVGRINVDAHWKIVRQQRAASFIKQTGTNQPALPISQLWQFPSAFTHAVARRFANQDAPRFAITATNSLGDTAEFSLSTYTSRSRPPRSVRISLREVDPRQHNTIQLQLTPEGQLTPESTPIATTLPEALIPFLKIAATEGYTNAVSRIVTLPNDDEYELNARRHTVTWPHAPVRGHWLGIDSAGRDVLARIIYGLRTSMTFGLLLVLCAMFFGTITGSIQGYFAGWIDLSFQRIIEIWSALPFLYVMILLGSVYGRSFMLLITCYALFNWIGMSYYMRAEFLRLRHREFVDAARCSGVPTHRIMFRHILPNAITPLITFFPFSLVGAIGSLAALDYLGFGLPPPTPSWGELFQQAQSFRWAWWLILYPALALFCVMLLGVFIGEGVRDAFDPKPFTRIE